MGNILYLGLEIPQNLNLKEVIHHPVIKISELPFNKIDEELKQFKDFTHLIFTSKSAAVIFMERAKHLRIRKEEIQKKCIVVVGKKTAAKLKEHEIEATRIANDETAEGVVEILSQIIRDRHLAGLYFFWPHSSRARSVIVDWLNCNKVKNLCIPIYDTLIDFKEPKPDLEKINEIIFTSPSTVDGFLQGYGRIPDDKILTCIGPVTKEYLEKQKEKRELEC